MTKASSSKGKRRSRNRVPAQMSPNENIFRDVLQEEFGKDPSSRGLRKGVKVKLFVAQEGKGVEVGVAKLGTAGAAEEPLQRQLHLHKLPSSAEHDLVVITSTSFKEEKKGLPYPYTFKGGEGVPKSLEDIFSQGFYAWETRMMCPLEESGEEEAQGEPVNQPYSSNTESKEIQRSEGSRNASGDVIFINDDDEETVGEHGRMVDIRHYDVTNYDKEDIWISLDNIVVPTLSLRDVDMPSVHQLQERFRKFGYDYSSGLMTVTILRSCNEGLKDLESSSLVEEGKRTVSTSKEVIVKQLKRGLEATLVDGMHRRAALMLLRAEPSRDESMKWLDEPIRVTLQTRSDRQDMRSTEILFIGMQRNQVSSTVRAFSGLEQHVTGIVSYLKSFAKEAGLKTSQVRPSNLADEMNSSNFITGMSRDTYRRYARIAKVFAKHENALTRLKEINNDEDVKLGAAHVDHSLFYEMDEVGVLLLLDTVAAYVRNPETTGKFDSSQFFNHVKDSYVMLQDQYKRVGPPRNASMTFAQFLEVNIKQSSNRMLPIRTSFTNNVRLFNASKRHKAKNLERIRRLGARIENHFVKNQSPRNEEVPLIGVRDGGGSGGDGDVSSMRAREESTEPSAKPSGKPQEEVRHTVPSPVPTSPLRRSDRKRTATRKQGATEEVEVRVEKVRKRREAGGRREERHLKRARREIRETADKEVDVVMDEVDEEGYRVPVMAEESERTFDDVIPPLPQGLTRSSSPYVGEKEPSWQVAVTLSPKKAAEALNTAKSEGTVIHQTPWLSALHIPVEHRAHAFLNMDALIYHQKLAWLIAAKMMHQGDLGWEEVKECYKDGYGGPYFARHSLLLQERGFCVLEGFADSSCVPSDVLKELKPPTGIFERTLQEMLEKFQSTFPGEEALRDESKRTLWNPIVNEGEEEGDVEMRNSGRARYSSTRQLLVEHSEGEEQLRWVAERRAILDAWLGQLAVLIGLNKSKGARMATPKTGGRLLITGKGCPRQAAHNDFQVPERGQKDRCPGYFMITTGTDPAPIWVCDYSHQFVFRPLRDLLHFAKALKLRKIIIPSNSVFVGHGYVTHAGAGYSDRVTDNVMPRYHMYFIPEGISLPDSVFFAFGSQPEFAEEEIPGERLGGPKQSARRNGNDRDNVETKNLQEEAEAWELEHDTMAYISSDGSGYGYL